MDRSEPAWRAIYAALKAEGPEALRLRYPTLADNYKEVARQVLADLERERLEAEATFRRDQIAAAKLSADASRRIVWATWATVVATSAGAFLAWLTYVKVD